MTPQHLATRQRDVPFDAADLWKERIGGFRRSVVPWLDDEQALAGSHVLELGSGSGASTAALAEQGAQVVGLDLAVDDLATARSCLAQMGLAADLRQRNANDLADLADEGFDRIIYWAVLEHMTINERLSSLESAWEVLGSGGLLTVVETPNRLWPFDSHTSVLPYFSWLPYELAYRYSVKSERSTFNNVYTDDHYTHMDSYLRRGHGVSFHEFDLAIGDHRELVVGPSMQEFWRSRSQVRRHGWALSQWGRCKRSLSSFSPATPRAWLQPFLYLSIRKS